MRHHAGTVSYLSFAKSLKAIHSRFAVFFLFLARPALSSCLEYTRFASANMRSRDQVSVVNPAAFAGVDFSVRSSPSYLLRSLRITLAEVHSGSKR